MKKYMLFTSQDPEDEFRVFRGDFDTLSLAFRKIWCIAQNSAKLCIYKMVSRRTMRCVAQGFVNPEAMKEKMILTPRRKERKEELAGKI